MLATPEVQLESMVKKSTGVELPPGPQSILFKMQGSFEAGKLLSPEEVIPAAPKLEGVLAGLPALPKLEGALGGEEKAESFERSGKTAEEEKREEAGFARY